MATEEKIRTDLLLIVSKYLYRRYIQVLSSEEFITEDMFSNCLMNETHWIDKRNCYRSDGSRNSDPVLELFGSFSGESTDTIRADMVRRIKIESFLYCSMGHIVLCMKGIKFYQWCDEMEDKYQFPDEIMIYALSRTFNRHTLIVCRDRYWSTLELVKPLSEEELFSACHIHLVFLGCGMFAELKKKPFSTLTVNPITVQDLSLALNKIKGRGRPMKAPLNLSLSKCGEIKNKDIEIEETLPDGEHDTISSVAESAEESHYDTQLDVHLESINDDIEYTEIVVGLEPEQDNDGLAERREMIIAAENDNDKSRDEAFSDSDMEVVNIKEADHNYCTPETPAIIESSTTNPLITVPSAYWLHPLTVTESDIKGQNSTASDILDKNNSENDTDESMHSIMSNVSDKVQLMLCDKARKNKCIVPLQRLQPDIIKTFQPSKKSPEIDPYSSLEEIFDSDNDSSKLHPNTKEQQDPTLETGVTRNKTSYFMRLRKSTRLSTKPIRSTRSEINYADLFRPDPELDTPTRPKTKPKVLPEPSESRIESQEKIKGSGKIKIEPAKPSTSGIRRFFRKDPIRSKPPHRKRNIELMKQTNIKGQNMALKPISAEQSDDDNTDVKPVVAEKKKRYQFKTRTHGIIKRKQTRSFKCPKCNTRKESASKLNEHFKRNHPPMQCGKCRMSFTTPSGFSRHQYVHQAPHHPCTDCDKAFHFESELSAHRRIHLKLKHYCNKGNCKKSYRNMSDLLKHIRTHTGEDIKCDKCEYSTKNIRLYRNHIKVHSDELPFKCDICSTLFKHRTQHARHVNNPKKCRPVPKSNSPEY